MADNQQNGSADIVLDLFRRIDEKLTDVRDRVIQMEAQNYLALIEARRLEHEKLRDEYVEKTSKMEIEIARIKTQITPVVAAVSTILGAGIAFLFNLIH